jgi:hypothetical protein
MKVFAVIALMIGCLVVTGCNKGGGAATTSTGKGFELNNVTDQTVTQGDTNIVKVTLDRKGGFDGPITVELIGVPAGITVDGGNMQTLYPKDEGLTLKMAASPTAPVGDHVVTVKATANADGTALTRQDTFNLKIKSKT